MCSSQHCIKLNNLFTHIISFFISKTSKIKYKAEKGVYHSTRKIKNKCDYFIYKY